MVPEPTVEENSMARSARLFAFLSLVAAGLACSLPGAEEVGNVATSVAATLTAAAPGVTPPGPGVTPTDIAEPPTLTPPPSILRIVYLDAGNVMLMEGGAPPVALTGSGDAEGIHISDDGAKVVYTRRFSFDTAVEMRSVNVDGTGDLPLLTQAYLNSLYPLPSFTVGIDVSSFGFIPGSHVVIFNTRAIPAEVGQHKFNDLLTVDADSGSVTTLLGPGAGGDFFVSPDGSRIAFSQPEAISLIDSDGTDLVAAIVPYTPVITYSEYQYYAKVTWAPDSSAAGTAIPSSDPLAPGAGGSVWIIPASGATATHLADFTGDFLFGGTADNLSPDLSRIGFSRPTAVPNVSELVLANADGTGASVYATGEIEWLGWAPYSSHFTYSLGDPPNIQLGTPGGGPVPLAMGIHLRWINATQFLYTSGSFGSWMLQQGEIGAASVPLASPAGDFIAYDFDS
jgi:hypothetical protein